VIIDMDSMPSYLIHRLKDHLRQPFRYAPHVSGTASLKPRDYSPGETVEAASPYTAYFDLRETATPLELGDVLQSESGELRIFKFVGFEEAKWVLPDSKPELAPELTAAAAEPVPVPSR
jgi:hypothetical protein